MADHVPVRGRWRASPSPSPARRGAGHPGARGRAAGPDRGPRHTGIADVCAPSTGAGAASWRSWAGGRTGYLVADSDYEGLGTPGRHPYLVGVSEGRGVLDAALAAGRCPTPSPATAWRSSGTRRAGTARCGPGQIAAEWTPELDLVGTVAGAPATELPVILRPRAALPIAGFLYMIVAGFKAPTPTAVLSAALTPAGEAQLSVVDQAAWPT